MPRFVPNLTLLFTELPLLERFAAAADAGFGAVELQFPYAHGAQEVRAAARAAAVDVVLFNLPAGDWAGGERGIAGLPGREPEFHAGVEWALEYADALGCPRLNCLAGLRAGGATAEEQRRTLAANVRHAAERVAAHGRTLLVEPVNEHDVPGFLLPTTGAAIALLDELGDARVKLQFDAYHVQRGEGDVTRRLRELRDRIGHVQIADSPERHEPGTGELRYEYLFDELDRLGYDGWVGLEYIPKHDTARSLEWLAPGRA